MLRFASSHQQSDTRAQRHAHVSDMYAEMHHVLLFFFCTISADKDDRNPQGVQLQATGAESILIQWRPALSPLVLNYLLKIIRLRRPPPAGDASWTIVGDPWWVRQTPGQPFSLSLRGLQPFTDYGIEMYGETQNANSTGTGMRTITTKEAGE